MADDFSEVFSLEADLRGAPAVLNRYAEKVLKVTSHDIDDDWSQGATVSRGYAESYAAAISYTISYPSGAIEFEIGPVLGSTAGASAGFLEDAPGNVRSAPQHAGRDALEANEPGFIRGLEIALFDATAEAVEG